ncbi:MAG: NADH-quinone oxidoreductase subunit N [Chloroflexi bacterium]|nr:NADH-quinone oxidoreductase subunit N [Chloroflexota bacterium]
MSTENLTANLYLLTPEFVLAGFALLVFVLDLFMPDERKDLLGWLSVLGLIGIAILSIAMLVGVDESLYNGLLAVDEYALFFKVFFIGIGVFIILSSIDYVRQHLNHPGEFYGLLLFSILGMNLMAMSRELLTAYISLELLSFSLYVMVAYALGSPRSNEASLKYIIVGSVSSAILLYGISMVYSTLGVTRFGDISEELKAATDVSPALWAGLALIVAGLGFKLAAVPFHMWAPDVYEGAPLPVTAYLAIASKAAAFALVIRLLAEAFVPVADRWDQWQIILVVLAALSMLVGNLVALAQRNLKRLMAYSSVGHVGYILAGVAVLSTDSLLGANGVIFYLVGYSVTSMVVFAALIAFFNATGQEEIADLAGLADRQPFLAMAIAIGLFSLSGLPIFVGFTMKFYLFTAVANEGFLWVAGLAILTSLISLYYYLQVIRQMYIQPALAASNEGDDHGSHVDAEDEAGGSGDNEDDHTHTPAHHDPASDYVALPRPSAALIAVVFLGLVATVGLGVYPAPLLELVESASAAVMQGG